VRTKFDIYVFFFSYVAKEDETIVLVDCFSTFSMVYYYVLWLGKELTYHLVTRLFSINKLHVCPKYIFTGDLNQHQKTQMPGK
jgi:hypothetical protein